jgi:hypothetical protein
MQMLSRITLVFLCMLISSTAFSQGIIGIPSPHWGIGIGNSERFSGLRFNFIDKNIEEINGINFTIWYNKDFEDHTGNFKGLGVGLPIAAGTKNRYGLSAGIFAVGAGNDVIGLNLGGLAVGGGRHVTGFNFGGLVVGAASNVTGLNIGGLAVASGMILWV